MDGIFFTPSQILKFNDRRLDLLNVKYIVMPAKDRFFQRFAASGKYWPVFNDEHVAILENRSVLPRAFAIPASRVEVWPEVIEQLCRLRNPEFDLGSSAVVAQLPASLSAGPVSASHGFVRDTG